MNRMRFVYKDCELTYYSGKYYHLITYLLCNLLTPILGIFVANCWFKVNKCSGEFFKYLRRNSGRRLNSEERNSIIKIEFIKKRIVVLMSILAFVFWTVLLMVLVTYIR